MSATTTTKGGETLYVHVNAESDKEIDFLYKNEEELSNALKAAIQEQGTQVPNLEASAKSHYEAILNIVSPNHSKKAKELACQFIPKYAANFPSLSSESMSKQLDLCEEEDKSIRINATKGLPKLCINNTVNISQVTSILTQLLKEEDPVEAKVVRQSLNELMDIDPKETFKSLLDLVATPAVQDSPKETELLREKTVEFISEIMFKKRKAIQAKLSGEDTEKEIITVIEKILRLFASSSFSNKEKEAEHMRLFLSLVARLKSYEKDSFKFMQFLRNHIPVDLTKPLDLADEEDRWKLRKLISFLRAAKKGMVHLKDNAPYFSYLMNQIFPSLNNLNTSVPEEDKLRVDTLKAITEIALFTSENHSRAILPLIYQTLKNEIPEKDAANPKLNLTNIECFLFIFHQLAFKAQGSLNEICGIKIITGQPTDNYGDFKQLRQDMLQRLGNLEAAVSPYVPRLEESIKVLKAEKKEENKEKVRMETQILNCAKNILELTRALKKNRPDFISTLTTKPSWITYRKKVKNTKRKDRDGKDNNQGKNKVQKRDNNQNKNNQRRIDSSSNNRDSGSNNRGGRGRGRGGNSNRGGRRF
ncbi:apoptosis inhibitory 5 family protein [Naegleria gruberi]|uniref:Apoptosis inhibitory 5 family protein n=1 Tax=Naegleria gruberi TaxID=5762 RepID=D2W0T7_NAEGR|nr:apoptosis inhibitory 5 family protein [Naegleria gruberi]EFC37395.1 apoptosis inhibitory 5 family protein [Naegleria gruberi]|eukprot:XP_002670139.1 apoptosis inhibitory 5 family protein [Naegleria gruberi strain NEG-M]